MLEFIHIFVRFLPPHRDVMQNLAVMDSPAKDTDRRENEALGRHLEDVTEVSKLLDKTVAHNFESSWLRLLPAAEEPHCPVHTFSRPRDFVMARKRLLIQNVLPKRFAQTSD